MRTSTQARALASAAALAAVAAAAAPSPALAAGSPFTCEASALSLSVLGQTPIEPVTTGKGAAACTSNSVGIGNLTQPLPPIFGVSAINASTFAAGTDVKQQALAAGGIADAKVGGLSSLGIDLTTLTNQFPTPSIPVIKVPIGGLTGPLGGLLGALPGGAAALPTSIDVDISAAVRALLALPSTNVLEAKAAVAYASGSCATGQPVLAATRNLAGVKVLGNEVNVDQLGDQPIVDTQTIDPSQIDLSKVVITTPLGTALTGLQLTQLLTTAVKPVLDALPDIPVPVDLAHVVVSPGATTRTATSIEQTGPTVDVTVLGQKVVNVRLGQAKVGSAGVDCAPPAAAPDAPTTAADTALECTKRRLVLVDVVERGNKVLLTGAADKKFVGKFVTIKFRADGSTAGRALVKPDGSFETTAPMPSAKLRTTNLARYQATIGSERSLDLKLARRLTVERLSSKGGKVTISGRVVQPLSTGAKTIEVRRRVSCKKSVVVKRFQPRANGTYTVTVDAPEGQSAAVYRLATRVRKNTSNKKTFPTFTLPRGVDLVS